MKMEIMLRIDVGIMMRMSVGIMMRMSVGMIYFLISVLKMTIATLLWLFMRSQTLTRPALNRVMEQ